MRVHWLQHVPWEGLGRMADWFAERDYEVTCTSLHEDDPPEFPSPDDIDWLVVMGGPMNVYETDEYPWLIEEKRFLKRVIRPGILGERRRLLGICLGAQLLAETLGARIFRAPEAEYGWSDVSFLPVARKSEVFSDAPDRLEVFQWHRDTFGLPLQAIPAARSEVCEQQAFCWDERVVGLQYHVETGPGEVEELLDHDPDIIESAGLDRDALLGDEARFDALATEMERLLERMSALDVKT